MMMGKEPFRPAGMYWKRNGIVAGIVVLLTAALVAWFVYLRATRQALLLGPRQFDHGNWAIALPNQPDLAWSGLLWSCGLMALGMYQWVAAAVIRLRH